MKSTKERYDTWRYETYVVPTWALGYLINSDASGLSDEDQAAVDRFVDDIHNAPGNNCCLAICPTDDEEEFFTHRNDVHSLGDTCMEIQFLVFYKSYEK